MRLFEKHLAKAQAEHPERHYFTQAEIDAVIEPYRKRRQIWNGMTDQLLHDRYGPTVAHHYGLSWYMAAADRAVRP